MENLQSNAMSEKRILPLFLLFFFLAWLGVHRFYVGKIGTAILFILTLGGLGVWWIIDLILIVTGNLRDKQGNKITHWT
jgi:TM2 domain-containing membrane protein YozV